VSSSTSTGSELHDLRGYRHHAPWPKWTGIRILAVTTRRILTAVSAMALCLAACSSSGTAMRSSSGPSVTVSARAVPHHRTVIIDVATGRVVELGTPGSPRIVILNPATGAVVRVVN